MSKSLVKKDTSVLIPEKEIAPLFERCFLSIREEIRDNAYIEEALRVLPVQGYRSAIGSFWNAVVDDLRNKIIHRSLELFNKSMSLGKEIKCYEDFQNYVNDDQLIEGAYKIGIIGWEASKVLKHAKETRHIFDGHPRSSSPSIIKVLSMLDDCIKYVLNEEYPMQIIDIDEYMTILGDPSFDRNNVAIENALTELPEIYKIELSNRLFSAYIHKDSSTSLRSNIEFVIPILWNVLPKKDKIQIVRRVDQEISKGKPDVVQQAFHFVNLVNSNNYLSVTSRKYLLKPLIDQLNASLDEWATENRLIQTLLPYASLVPIEYLDDYVAALTHTYIGKWGYSMQFSRQNFYADGASLLIPQMFSTFDDNAAKSFIKCIKTSFTLRSRIHYPAKLQRLRSLGNILLERVSGSFEDIELLELLVDEKNEDKFKKEIGRIKGE